MKLAIVTDSEHDVTRRLDEESSMTVTIERERGEFNRYHSDVRATLSDMNGSITEIFKDVRGSDNIGFIFDGDTRRLFKGYVKMEGENTGVVINTDKKKVTFTAIETFRGAWELMKKKPIDLQINQDLSIGANDIYTDVEHIIKKNFTGAFNSNLYSQFFSDVEIRNGIGAGVIRYAGVSTDPNIGNEGRYSKLDPQTKVSDLIEAILLHHNAECFIDYTTNNFVIQRRLESNPDVMHDLDVISRDDVDAIVLPYGAKKWDYVHALTNIEKPGGLSGVIALYPRGLNNSYMMNQTDHAIYVDYYVTYVIDGIESVPSDIVRFKIEPSVNRTLGGLFGQPYYTYMRIIQNQNLPITEYKVYRTDQEIRFGAPYIAYRLRTFPATETGEDIFFSDLTAHPGGEKLDTFGRPWICAAWFGYDEPNMTYRQPVLDILGGKNRPSGTIFDSIAKLIFVDAAGETQSYSPFDVFALFGKQTDTVNTIAFIRERWKKLLLTEAIVKISAKGTDYNIGDEGTASRRPLKFFGNKIKKMVLKQAVINPFKKESELEFIGFLQ